MKQVNTTGASHDVPALGRTVGPNETVDHPVPLPGFTAIASAKKAARRPAKKAAAKPRTTTQAATAATPKE